MDAHSHEMNMIFFTE